MDCSGAFRDFIYERLHACNPSELVEREREHTCSFDGTCGLKMLLFYSRLKQRIYPTTLNWGGGGTGELFPLFPWGRPINFFFFFSFQEKKLPHFIELGGGGNRGIIHPFSLGEDQLSILFVCYQF